MKAYAELHLKSGIKTIHKEHSDRKALEDWVFFVADKIINGKDDDVQLIAGLEDGTMAVVVGPRNSDQQLSVKMRYGEKEIYWKCYLCGWEGNASGVKMVRNIKGPMFGQLTNGYKCPNCGKIAISDGEDYELQILHCKK